MTSSNLRARFGALTPASRMLVVNQFGINVGFYMVLPFLTVYLATELGWATALIGILLGVRVLSQQAMFFIGGTAADRLGCRPMIVLGCALRVVSFGMFALFTSAPVIIAAAILTGVAGALFNPAVRSYLSREASTDKVGAFAVFNTAADAGAFVGPLLGAALLVVDFRVVAAVAAAVFAVLTIVQILVLPAREVDAHPDSMLGSWLTVLRNRRFLAFTVCGSGYFALYNQLYLVLPLELERVTGTATSVAVLFAMSTVIGVLCYVPVAAWGTRQLPAGSCVALGLTLMAAGFVPVALSTLLPAATGTDLWSGLVVLGGAVVFTFGIALANPFTMQLIPVVGGERLTGTYYGFFYLGSGLVAGGTSIGVAALWDAGSPAVASLSLVVLGLVCAIGTQTLQRRGMLSARESA